MRRSDAAVVIVVASALILIATLMMAAPRKEVERKGPAEVTVVLDFGGETPSERGPGSPLPWSFEVRLDNGTVFGALGKAASAGNFTFVSEWYPNFRSHRVTEIAGVTDGTGGKYWQFYVNDVYVGTGADLTALGDGDTVRWAFKGAMQ